MGPLLVLPALQSTFVMAYEHGSQYPDRFLEFHLLADRQIRLSAVKGNYLKDQGVNGFQSVWLEVAGTPGNETALAGDYRQFVLKYLTQNSESRKPYVFYNTWGRQERVQWAGAKYLTSMNLGQTLKEIDRAHAMGIEVFVLDAGWFQKTGDWNVNLSFFPDSLKQVIAKLNGYGMKLGLWFNPTVAAVSSDMYARNKVNRMSWNGKHGDPHPIWETEESVGLCLVSPYWQDFADKLIALSKTLGVTYFKWDAIGQYGCNDAHHYHGSDSNSLEERTQSYAFQQPEYMSKVVDRLCKEVPEAIVDFDITEDGRCVGLQFLAAGKYFIINNGPYYHNFDLAPAWKSALPNGNANIFVQPGPARGWFVRSVLDYEPWIPSVLFLTHYQPDEPRNSQVINIASLILGQNGIWGEILNTSDSGVHLFHAVLSKYKQVRTEITAASLVQTGAPGGSPEIYEKIDEKTGKGCLVLFANSKGEYQYITSGKPVQKLWHTKGIAIKYDTEGRAVVTASFSESSAHIILFGAE
jgi:alpha-galactosidase